MRALQTWPRGLRLVFWCFVLGTLVGTGQLRYWTFATHEFSPHVTLQGGYAAIAFMLELCCLGAGLVGWRRTFALTALVASVVHVCVTSYFSLEMGAWVLQDALAGRFGFWTAPDLNMWIYHWNGLCILTNALIAFYICRYELHMFETA